MPSPSRPPPNLAVNAGARGPETGDLEIEETARWRWWVTSPSPGGGPGGESCCCYCCCWLLFCFVVCTKDISKGVVSQSLGLKRRTVVNRASWDCFPPPLLPAGSSRLPKSTPPVHLWNQVRAVALESPLQVVTRRAVTSLKPGSCVPPARGGIRCVLHCTPRPRPLPSQARPSQAPGWVPVFHLAAPPWVHWWTRWSRWHGLSEPVKTTLPSPPRWLLRTIRLGYAIPFPPGVLPGSRASGSIKVSDAPVLRADIVVLLANDAIEPVPPADMRSGFVSRYFIVPKKSSGLPQILDLGVLIRALHKLPFKTLKQKRIFECVRPLDRFAAIDLKDTCIHVSILPQLGIPAIRIRG